MTVKKMSTKTADILFGGTSVKAADFDADTYTFTTLDDTISAFHTPVTELTDAELLAGVEWAIKALQNYPTTPALPVVELVLPFPSWEEA